MVGYFDILHSGHILAMQIAKQYGDYLVIGIEPDTMSTYMKGKGRPYLSERERAFVVSHLDIVDEVICLPVDESYKDKSDELFLDAVKPDVFLRTKVDNHILSACRSRGIQFIQKVEIIGIDEMHSTDIINKIRTK